MQKSQLVFNSNLVSVQLIW